MLSSLPLIGKKSAHLLGVDISSTAVKILELSNHHHHYKIESYAVAAIPQHAVIENDIKDIQAVATAIELAYSCSHSPIKAVAAAVPNSATITKVLQIDASINELEMSEYISLEAARYIPFPIEEVALDFTILDINEKETNKVDVLIVAARKEHVESRADAIQAAGLNPKIIDVESYAIERVCNLIAYQLPNKGKNQTIAVINIGSTFTTLSILHDLQTIYSKDEVFGGHQLTENIQKKYGLPYEQAELMKKQNQFSNDYIPEVLTPFCELLITLIRRSLQLFFSASHFTSVEHILLTGGSAMIPALTTLIQTRLGIPCTIANPFAEMSLSAGISAASIAVDSSSLMTCCGLALRSFKP